MSNLLSETLVTAAEATKIFPTRPSPATVWRWMTRGTRGLHLESVVVGGQRYTSREAIARFLERLADTDTTIKQIPEPRSKRERRESVKRAERILASAGI